MTNINTRPLRSVALTDLEREKLKTFVARYPTQDKRAAALGLNRASLLRISQCGSGSEANIKKVRQKLKTVRVE